MDFRDDISTHNSQTYTKNMTPNGTLSTVSSQKSVSRISKKAEKYEPIREKGKVYNYEDNPDLYMKVRK